MSATLFARRSDACKHIVRTASPSAPTNGAWPAPLPLAELKSRSTEAREQHDVARGGDEASCSSRDVHGRRAGAAGLAELPGALAPSGRGARGVRRWGGADRPLS